MYHYWYTVVLHTYIHIYVYVFIQKKGFQTKSSTLHFGAFFLFLPLLKTRFQIPIDHVLNTRFENSNVYWYIYIYMHILFIIYISCPIWVPRGTFGGPGDSICSPFSHVLDPLQMCVFSLITRGQVHVTFGAPGPHKCAFWVTFGAPGRPKCAPGIFFRVPGAHLESPWAPKVTQKAHLWGPGTPKVTCTWPLVMSEKNTHLQRVKYMRK